MTEDIATLSEKIARLPKDDLEARLSLIASNIDGRKVFTSSLGMEDQCITHAIFSADLDIDVVTLDTGRLFPETYDLWAKTETRYNKKITPFYPKHADVEALVAKNGINGFYDGLDERKSCCHVRKVEPLNRALDGGKVWVTGIRAKQSAGRESMKFIEHDGHRNIVKVNPLLDWSNKDLDGYVSANTVPVNALHAQSYPSIGCQPCTRAVAPGEDERAGRWWWENDNQECGLHVGPDGRLVRTGAS